MSIYATQLSHEELTFFNLVNNIGCITVNQANQILRKYLKCSSAQAERVIQNLSNHQYICMNKDHTYITAGTKNTKYHEKINPKTVRAMHICIDFVDNLEDMAFTHIPADNSNLIFLTEGKLYKVIDFHTNELFKIHMMQQIYTDTIATQKNAKNINPDAFSFTTIFTVPPTEDKDVLLDVFENITITFPCIIAYFTEEGTFTKPAYELYRLNMD